MITQCYEISEELKIVPIAPEEVPAACQDDNARLWLDLQDPGPGDVETWLDKLAVTGLARQLCLEARDRPGFYPLKTEIFMAIPVLAGIEPPLSVDNIGFFCRKHFLLTVHHKPILDPKEIDDAEDWLQARTIASLVSAIMIHLSLEGLQRNSVLRGAVVSLEEKMDREPDAAEAEDILDVRAELLMHETVSADQLPSIRALSVVDKPFFKLEDTQEYINCALANAQTIDRALDRLAERVRSLRSGFEMNAQDKTNRRLNMLTILSAIFMPITLLAGIWGMNFEVMPELKYAFAYPLALGFMTLVGWGMYFLFRRRGFFD